MSRTSFRTLRGSTALLGGCDVKALLQGQEDRGGSGGAQRERSASTAQVAEELWKYPESSIDSMVEQRPRVVSLFCCCMAGWRSYSSTGARCGA